MLTLLAAGGNHHDGIVPVFDDQPQDLRPYFLSEENLHLMSATMRFAKQYVSGAYKLNNLALMNCSDLKRASDCLLNTACDKCKRDFKHFPAPELFCVIYKRNLVENETNSHNKFKLICGTCYRSLIKNDNTKICIQLFPKLLLSAIEDLCRYNFITKYLFHIDLEYKLEDKLFRDETRDVYVTFKDIVINKKPNEQIQKISLLTYEKTLFSETIQDCSLVHDNGKNVLQLKEDDRSAMVAFASQHEFLNLTYFYKVTKRVYTNRQFDYTAYFAKPFLGYNKRLACGKCKSKFYKNNPILYCSKCGFMNRMHFVHRLDKFEPIAIQYYPECVKAHKTRQYCIMYYDLTLYERKSLK
ncbi:Major early transcription protein 53 [Trabala vishnou gigantina nucleopolyhedrovirus]|uniref:Major early transcription protein 53 n=1 Tax=Trabala vishnou gigantina nucleopolyhedrovirus TaxID=2863583 RepID=UPI002481A25D|nr:Major early transcription protein 53 [Trabala vishnou gigantina nucleopolyhedrovirus]QYC92693.1 Major early transcription protein 53 [Trabala vishnou gigantina nucleopolyhedrovirus]